MNKSDKNCLQQWVYNEKSVHIMDTEKIVAGSKNGVLFTKIIYG